MSKAIFAVAFAVVLVGCAAPQRPAPVALTEPTPVCKNDKQCEAMWARVPEAIEMVTRMRVQSQSDFMIDTYAPPRGEVRMYGRVVKRPMPTGGYAIEAYLECRSAAVCDGLRNPGMNLFNATITGAGAPFIDN